MCLELGFLLVSIKDTLSFAFNKKIIVFIEIGKKNAYLPDNLASCVIKQPYPLCIIVVILISPKEDRRRFMLSAYDLGMTAGEYVFYTLDFLPDRNVINPADVWEGDEGRDEMAKEAFESVFHVSLLGFILSPIAKSNKATYK